MVVIFCSSSEIGKLAVLKNGRVKPLYVHANEIIKHVTGKRKIGEYSALEAYCRLSLSGLFPSYDMKVSPLIEHVAIKEILDYDSSKPLSAAEIESDYKSELLIGHEKKG